MRLIYLGARRSATFTNSDFHGLDVSQPIQISITLGQLDDPLKNIDSYGDYLVGFNVATGKIEPEPGTGLEPALNLQLTVQADLEPEWTLVSPRAQAMGRTRNLAWADRVRIAPGRLGATGQPPELAARFGAEQTDRRDRGCAGRTDARRPRTAPGI